MEDPHQRPARFTALSLKSLLASVPEPCWKATGIKTRYPKPDPAKTALVKAPLLQMVPRKDVRNG